MIPAAEVRFNNLSRLIREANAAVSHRRDTPIARLTRPGRLGTVRCEARTNRSGGVGSSAARDRPFRSGATRALVIVPVANVEKLNARMSLTWTMRSSV